MNRIIVTGANGFVGTNLCTFLEEFYEVVTLQVRFGQTNHYDFFEGDTVIHLAAKAHDLKKVSIPADYYDSNYELTKEIYDAFLKSNLKKFIFISSVKASADQVERILSEQDIPDPKTDYGKSKLMAEEYITSKPLPPGKSYYILRPCMIHGPGNKGNLNLLYQMISYGIPYPLALFKNKRSFLSMGNLAFVIKELIIRKDIPQGIYNISDDDALSTNELVALMAGALDRKPLLWNISPKLVFLIARIGDVLKLPLNSERLKKLTENYIVDNSKIREALGIELPVKARNGIIDTVQSFRKKL